MVNLESCSGSCKDVLEAVNQTSHPINIFFIIFILVILFIIIAAIIIGLNKMKKDSDENNIIKNRR